MCTLTPAPLPGRRFGVVARELGGDLLAIAAAVLLLARYDAAAGDMQAQAWLNGEAAASPGPDELERLALPTWAPALLAGLRQGLTVRQAATAAGVSHNTVYTWARRLPAFAAALSAAQGSREAAA